MPWIFPKDETSENIVKTVKTSNCKVVIWGAGKIGFLVLNRLRELGIEIDCFCDNAPDKQGTVFHGYPVKSPQEYVSSHQPVVIASRAYDEMRKQGKTLGIPNLLPCYPFFPGRVYNNQECLNYMHALLQVKRQWMVARFQDRQAVFLPSLDVVVTEKCSLRCRDCSNLMQYYTHPQHEDMDLAFYALDRIMEAVDYVGQFRVLGGEPFVNKELYRFIERLAQYDRYGEIIVYTNGTIVPTDENLNCLKKDALYVSISNYGKASKNIVELTKVFNMEGILYDVKEVESWQDCASIVFHDRDEKVRQNIFDNCCCNRTLSLRRGRLFGCPFSGNAWTLHGIPDFKSDYIDFTDEKKEISEERELINALLKCNTYRACDYCNGRFESDGTVPPAIQTKTPLPYREFF